MKNNPYIGPRPFERHHRDRFFGREREGRELQALIVAEREVLFYAQSGAGKSSLINARIIPGLEDQGYSVLPVARVGNELPPGIQPGAVKNIFVFSALLSLAGEKADPQTLAGETLAGWLREPCRVDLPILIFDQFEEIFTTHRERWQESEDFFRQMREALDAYPNLGVVFAMREDYLASIDNYVMYFGHRLRARFRMELLGVAGALAAVKKPAQAAGCAFAPDVAERLVDNLRQIKVQRQSAGADEEEAEVTGPYIEPVQLQVVCNRLWENLPEQVDASIHWADVEQYGDIDGALTDFYQGAITAALAQVKGAEEIQGLAENAVRRWFGEELITPMETRGLVMRGPETTAGLPNAVVDALEGQHIIRADMRAGARWYELSHDRLIQPINKSNAEWFEKNLSLFQRQAVHWIQQGRSEGLLLRGNAFLQAEQQARSLELSTEETEFLDACRKMRVREQRDLRQRQMITGALVVSVLLLAVAIFFGYNASQSTQRAEQQAFAAQTSEANAQAASTLAVNNANAAVAAQADAENNANAAATAQANAENNAKIAFAGQLATRAELLINWDFQDALLVGIESFRLLDNSQTRGALMSVTKAQPQISHFLSQHIEPVSSVAFSPDGKILSSGSWDNTIILWDVATRQPIGQPLRGHTNFVSSVAFSSDGKTLASGSWDNTVILWDVASRQPIGQPLTGHTNYINSVVFSPDGKTLASSSDDSTIILWDVATRQAIGQPLKGHQTSVMGIAFSPDGQLLASGSWDKTIRLWDVATRRPIGQLAANHRNEVQSIAFSPDGKTLASGSWDNTVILWDVASRQPIGQPLTGHTGAVYGLAFSPDGKTLVSGSWDKTIILWDFATRQAIARPLMGHKGAIYSIAFSPDGKTLASGGIDTAIIVWDITRQQTTSQQFGQGTTFLQSVAFSPDGKTIATGDWNGAVRLWDVATRQPIGQPIQGHSDGVMSVAFSPDGKTLASGSLDNTIILWDVATRQLIGGPLLGHTDAVSSLAFSPDGKTLASGSWDKTIILWEVATYQPIGQPLTGHSFNVSSIAFSPDGKTLASGSDDRTVILWDIAKRNPLSISTGQTRPIRSVAFSPDGKILASGSEDKTIILWDIAKHRRIGSPLKEHSNGVTSLAFSPDGKTLASGSMDATIILWDIATSRSVGQPLTGHTRFIESIAFSPVSSALASVGRDGIIILWDIDPQSWIEKSCLRAGRNLTRTEWKQYGFTEEYRATCPQWPLEP